VPKRKVWISAVIVRNSPAPSFYLALTGQRVYLTTSKSVAWLYERIEVKKPGMRR
jgi:hypothetical protein